MSRFPLSSGVLAVTALIFAGCTDGPTATSASSAPAERPTSYIVLLRDTTGDASAAIGRIVRGLPSLRTSATISAPGVSARVVEVEPAVEVLTSLHAAVLSGTTADARALRADPAVALVEPVREMHSSVTGLVTTSSWALDRIDQVALPLNGRVTRFGTDGAGVRIAIFDTGIRWTHSDLRGRVVGGYDAFAARAKTSGDVQGHGTYVASLAAGTTFGTAPLAQLLDVQVLNAQGSGTNVELARGVDWVIAEKRRVAGPMVANMSLGFRGGSTVVDALVDRLRAAGIVVAVAAGNEGADACGTSPARAPGAITVGATANGAVDIRAAFSNGGRCVDLSAPGERILGAGSSSDAAGVIGSGTSMSTPFVAGAAAAYLGVNKAATPDAVAAWLIAESTSGGIQGLMAGTPNRLLTLRRLPVAGTTPAPAPIPAPAPATPAPAATMSLTSSCVARTCTITAGVPAGVTAADAPTLVYAWKLGNVATMAGTNLRRQVITFGSAASIVVTVTARKGSLAVGTTSVTVSVK
ncbi:MAG: S8 family peptidase [Gemmatimonadaceae bacterium]|nr:S8 family peptidase [Gemmatimonadaceae bacterium]